MNERKENSSGNYSEQKVYSLRFTVFRIGKNDVDHSPY
jgi:hypothetical protein